MEVNESKSELFLKELSLEIKRLFIQFIKILITEKIIDIKNFIII